jgi:hypothetical protein
VIFPCPLSRSSTISAGLARQIQSTIGQVQRFEETMESHEGAAGGLAAQVADLRKSVPELRGGSAPGGARASTDGSASPGSGAATGASAAAGGGGPAGGGGQPVREAQAKEPPLEVVDGPVVGTAE